MSVHQIGSSQSSEDRQKEDRPFTETLIFLNQDEVRNDQESISRRSLQHLLWRPSVHKDL